MAQSAARKKASKTKSGATKGRRAQPEQERRSRTLLLTDDDDQIMSSGAGGGIGFGRCGGRVLQSQLEQTLCNHLTQRGIAHSHTPRHFEVRVRDESVAAYPPMIVLRGRGREGKTVVIEGMEHIDAPLVEKISAFRSQYGGEFYVTFIADEEVLDELPLSAYDESCTLRDLNNLMNRLAE